jgi:hypothetical protein
MDDETDHLLDAFLDAASGERTADTRERYQRTLAHLHRPVEGERGCGPGTRLLMRVAHELSRDDPRARADERETMPSLYERLVTWLRRHSDAGDDDVSCVLLETQSVVREVRRERARRRYPMAPPGLITFPPRIDPVDSDDSDGEFWSRPPLGELDGERDRELDGERGLRAAWWEDAVYPANVYTFRPPD